MGIGNILKGKNLDTSSGAAKVTVIGNNSQFTGNITFTGTLKVSGTVSSRNASPKRNWIWRQLRICQ